MCSWNHPYKQTPSSFFNQTDFPFHCTTWSRNRSSGKNFPYRWSDEVIYKTNKLTKTIYDLSILQYFASNSCLFFPFLRTRKNVDTEKIFKSNQIIISWIYNKMLSRDILKLILTIWDDNSFLCDKKELGNNNAL